jgi:hypothetical protein
MFEIAWILLQPDPNRWGDPDDLPINQDVGWLFVAALILGAYTLYKSRMKKEKGEKIIE